MARQFISALSHLANRPLKEQNLYAITIYMLYNDIYLPWYVLAFVSASGPVELPEPGTAVKCRFSWQPLIHFYRENLSLGPTTISGPRRRCLNPIAANTFELFYYDTQPSKQPSIPSSSPAPLQPFNIEMYITIIIRMYR